MGRSKGMLDGKLAEHSDTKGMLPGLESQIGYLLSAWFEALAYISVPHYYICGMGIKIVTNSVFYEEYISLINAKCLQQCQGQSKTLTNVKMNTWNSCQAGDSPSVPFALVSTLSSHRQWMLPLAPQHIYNWKYVAFPSMTRLKVLVSLPPLPSPDYWSQVTYSCFS